MKTLVTGASGFVGSMVCRALHDAGHHVTGLSRRPKEGAERVARQITWVQGSVAHPREIAAAARGCQALIHAAGLPPAEAPRRVLRWLHIAGSENVLRAARHAGIKRVVHISCADVSLSSEDRMHWDEKRALPSAPLGPFAQSKLTAEELMLTESDPELEVVALRPALLWGAGDIDGIARLAQRLNAGAGILYEGGRNIISTTHIDNLGKACLLALRAHDAASRAYYITDGEFLEAREFYAKLAAALGLPAPASAAHLGWATLKARFAAHILRNDAPLAELTRQSRSALFDVSRAVHDLGYQPHVDLSAKLQELSTWVREQGGLSTLLARARAAPEVHDVDEQVLAAGGD